MTTLPEPPSLPRIIVNNRQLRKVTEECIRALEQANDPPQLFLRGTEVVHITPGEKSRPAAISLVRVEQLRHFLTRCANFYKKRGSDRPDLAVSPPGEAISDMLALPERLPFPRLEAITHVPVIRADGSVLARPGYDPSLRLYHVPGLLKKSPPKIPENPTASDVRHAVGLLSEMLCDFPFNSPPSRANAFAMLVTSVIRPMIAPGCVPIFLIDANQAGAGKGLLADVLSLIHTGAVSSVKPAPDAGRNVEEEWKKVILSMVIAGAPITLLDNLDGVLRSPTLAAAVTSETYTDRLLGHSRMITAPMRTMFVVTGNNIILGGDMPRRCVWIRLQVNTSRPYLRSGFKHPNLKKWVLDRRVDLLGALLTVASAYYKAGAPQSDSIPQLGSFEAWSSTVGGILQFAEVEGFLANASALYDQADPNEAQWESLLCAIYSTFEKGKFTVQELVTRMNRSLQGETPLRKSLPDEIAESYTEEGGSLERRLGRAFLRIESRRYGAKNIRIEKAGQAHGRAVWRVRRDGCAEVAEFKPEFQRGG
jgi:hypothetical protein